MQNDLNYKYMQWFTWKRFLSLSLLFIGFILITGAGCIPSDFSSESKITPSSQTNTTDGTDELSLTQTNENFLDEETLDISNIEDNNIDPNHWVLLINSSCDSDSYKKQVKEIYRERTIGSYTILVVDASSKLQTDACIKMSFAASDLASLREMIRFLQADLQTQLEKTNWRSMVGEDLPGSCEEVVVYVKNKYPRFADRIATRCEALKQQQQGQEEGNKEDQYQNTNAACTIAPDPICSSGMDSSTYIRYAMDFIIPDDQSVISESKTYKSIDELYTFMQIQPWQSDTALFGCADKFQKPNYYLNTSPTLQSSAMCGYRVGDCEDQALTTVSLLIASGLVPEQNVRVAMGMVQSGSRPWEIGGHAWPEIYMDGHWFAMDPTMGSYCDENGKCTILNENQLINWDYFRYVNYPVVEYWGWSNDIYYYITSTGEGTSGLPSFWKEKSSIISPL
ncbi:hypothetical protein CO172_01950 [Candidatus Uhrbacteria bacterium CG_4_9_14_3_um_filter_36_7]|uniref:Transglutaminase-like domain-containing protein n=1 Tax=Candidatus Uhrbacteria bacterium CG_4_9_14_3_um_filter_36_7 TaxID=1975033 RepID=A0A2M7XHJ0_9BACT|nr:MAG: hypothetical protein CO172_01950 [Candidatus Uhrbacteria bacterium CG_4_9_14_3_um_filter_36_7]